MSLVYGGVYAKYIFKKNDVQNILILFKGLGRFKIRKLYKKCLNLNLGRGRCKI